MQKTSPRLGIFSGLRIEPYLAFDPNYQAIEFAGEPSARDMQVLVRMDVDLKSGRR